MAACGLPTAVPPLALKLSLTPPPTHPCHLLVWFKALSTLFAFPRLVLSSCLPLSTISGQGGALRAILGFSANARAQGRKGTCPRSHSTEDKHPGLPYPRAMPTRCQTLQGVPVSSCRAKKRYDDREPVNHLVHFHRLVHERSHQAPGGLSLEILISQHHGNTDLGGSAGSS